MFAGSAGRMNSMLARESPPFGSASQHDVFAKSIRSLGDSVFTPRSRSKLLDSTVPSESQSQLFFVKPATYSD